MTDVVFREDTSFPFLAAARRLGLPYGLVLRYSERYSFDLPGDEFRNMRATDCIFLSEVAIRERQRQYRVWLQHIKDQARASDRV